MRFLLFILLIVGPTNMLAADDSTQRIITQMRETYSSLRSYSDTGVVLAHILGDESPNETVFRSAFVRPHFFRFAWVTHHPYPPLRHIKTHSVIWSNATGSFYWSDVSGKEAMPQRQENLKLAVAGATGVSGGSAHTIASLLLPGVGLPMIENIKSIELAGVEPFESTICYHLIGQHSRIGRYEVWIGKDDYLLRKAAFQLAGIPHEEIRREIQTNVEISEQTFGSEK